MEALDHSDQNNAELIKFQKYQYRWNLFADIVKWFLGTFLLAYIALLIDSSIKERSQGLQEIQQYDKYVMSLIINADGAGQRRLLAQYYAKVTPSEPLRKGWEKYYAVVDSEYKAHLKQEKSLQANVIQLEKEITQTPVKDSMKKNELINRLLELNQKQVEVAKQTELKITEVKPSRSWIIVAGADKSLSESQFEAKKFKNTQIYKQGLLYRTIVGPYATKKEAEDALVPVKQQININAYVTTFEDWCSNPVPHIEGVLECK